MKIITIIGNRPQFIKAAPISKEMLLHPGKINEIIIHTGQHFDKNMSDIFFEQLKIPQPKYNLGVQEKTHGKQTGTIIIRLEEILLKEKPDIVLLYGDTNSTLAGAITAAKLPLKIAHVEAGIRSFRKSIPEEVNRIMTDHVSDLLFPPTISGKNQLLKEGIADEKICYCGDVMLDAALLFCEQANEEQVLENFGVNRDEYLLSTIHRNENTDNIEKLSTIFKFFNTLKNNTGLEIVLPLHPRTKKQIQQSPELLQLSEKVKIIEPIGFHQMVLLEKNCKAIITDSGGAQKEAFFHNKPAIVLFDESPWVELVNNGWIEVVNVTHTEEMLNKSMAFLNSFNPKSFKIKS